MTAGDRQQPLEAGPSSEWMDCRIWPSIERTQRFHALAGAGFYFFSPLQVKLHCTENSTEKIIFTKTEIQTLSN